MLCESGEKVFKVTSQCFSALQNVGYKYSRSADPGQDLGQTLHTKMREDAGVEAAGAEHNKVSFLNGFKCSGIR